MLVTYNFIDLVLPDNDLTTKMINKYIFSFGVLLFAFNSHAQTPCIDGFSGDYPCQNIDLLAHVSIDELGTVFKGDVGLNDVWGWTDPESGTEYVLVGMANGTAFIDIADPLKPIMLGMLPEHHAASSGGRGNSIWRDVKVYKDHAFIVSEDSGHGMQVFDLTQLRNVTNPPVAFSETANYDKIGAVHNIVINEDTGFAYAVGVASGVLCNGGGLHVINIQDPANPVYEACFDTEGYTHDAQCVIYAGPDAAYVGKEICFNFNGGTFVIANVDDKADMRTLASVKYDGVQYVHQGWLTDDHKYLLSNDELDEARAGNPTRTFIWDVQELSDPKLIGIYDHTTSAIDHNLYILGDIIFQSNYTSGLRMMDGTAINKGELFEIGYFDTYPADDSPQFLGSWSNYPYFKSGVIAVTDISTGLFLLKPNITTNYLVRQPKGVEICPDELVKIKIEVGGENQTYQWQVDTGSGFEAIANGDEYQGADARILEILNVNKDQSGYAYRCLVTYVDNSEMISDAATLSVKEGAKAAFSYEMEENKVSFTNESLLSDSYVWDFGDGSDLEDKESPVHEYSNEVLDYTVSLTAYGDCGSNVKEEQIQILVTDVSDELISENFVLYPNPTSTEIKINAEFSNNQEWNYKITSINGKRIKKGIVSTMKNSIDLRGIKSGTYIIQIDNSQTEIFSKRIIIE
jgi:choice-of-anchor B domain-containing protein